MCNYSDDRTWYDECCEAWKPKDVTDDKDMVAVVRCKDCKKRYTALCIQEEAGNINNQDDWFCADGERKEGW